MKRDSFVFYKSWNNVISDLSKDVQWEVYHAITEYAINGNLVELKPVAKVAFAFIKQDIDRAFEKYKEVKDVRSEAGRMGNLKRWNKDLYREVVSGNISLEEAESVAKYRKASQTSLNVDVDVDDNVNDNKENKFSMSDESDAKAASQLDFKKIIDFFNKTTKCEFGKVQYPISEKRKGLIRARIKEHGKSNFAKVINLACKSDFLRGQGEKAFKMTFDWMIKPVNFEKILSGNYKNRKNGKNKNRETSQIDTSETKHRDYSGGF